MMGRSSLWFPLVLLMFLAGISFWLDHTVQGSGDGKRLNDIDPESIVENFEAVRTDQQGRIKERLSARKLSHFSGSKLSELEAPHFVQMTPGAADMTATSSRATISHDSKEVILEGQVTVTRAGTGKGSALTLSTQRLLVYPERDLLRAPGPVTMKGPGLNVSASGMEVNSKLRLIKLSGRVKAQYQHAKL